MKLRTVMPALKGATEILNHVQNVPKSATLIYFWSMSCPQCEHSIAKLKEIEKIFQKRLVIRTIHMPRNETDYSMKKLQQMIQRLQISLPVFADHELKISDAFGNVIVPAYYLFDDKQQLRFYQAGFISTKALQQKIERIL